MSLLHITTQHRGKMAGMWSISTPCYCNARCKKNQEVEGSVCEKCYAKRFLGVYKNMRQSLEGNYKFLTERIIPEEYLPILNCRYFRIESFGDVANVNHAINYLNLIRKNPHVQFGWWTKNPDLIKKAFDKTGYEKPENVVILRSSMFLNKPCHPYYWFVDKTFTVYDSKTAKEKEIEVNCGAKSCIDCRLCYDRNDVAEIRELLK